MLQSQNVLLHSDFVTDSTFLVLDVHIVSRSGYGYRVATCCWVFTRFYSFNKQVPMCGIRFLRKHIQQLRAEAERSSYISHKRTLNLA